MTHIGPIGINHKYTNDLKLASEWIKQLGQYDIIACDFEAAVKYTQEDIEFLKRVAIDDKTKYLHRKIAESALAASALGHPAHSALTHFSVAWSDRDAYVFILDSFDITKLVLQFLVTTEVKQVWHNACFDFRFLLFHTGKMPKNYEDTQIFAKTLFNHVETHKAKTGLKELAGPMYGAWGVTEDLFSLSEMYNEKLIYYAAVDAAATFWVYQRILSGIDPLTGDELNTDAYYSPWDQLPAPSPKHALYPDHHFYHHTAKWLIRDTVRIMNNGLPIDLEEVVKLEEELEEIIADVKQRLADNSLVQAFLQRKQKSLLSEYIDLQKSRFKTPEDFLVSFDSKKPLHRDYFMYVFIQRVAILAPEQLGVSGKPKWSARTVKIISETYPPLKALIEHRVSPNNPTAVEAMKLLAEDKAEMYNQKFIKNIESPKVGQITFNPNSSLQKQEMFSWLGLQSDVQSAKTGLDSWDREQVERVNKETEDDDIRAFTQCLIDFSFAAIVRDNFIQAFYRYTVEGELHGNYRLLGKVCHSA